MKRFVSTAADGVILDAISTSNLPRLNDYKLSLIAFLFGHKRFVWWPHIDELTLQTLKKTSNCRYKRKKYSAGPTKSVAIGKVTTKSL